MGHNVEKQIERFNKHFPIGSEVRWRSVNKPGCKYQRLIVKGKAFSFHTQPVFFAEGIAGFVSASSTFVKFPKK